MARLNNFINKIFKPYDQDRPFFPGQEKDEEVIFFTRRHPLSFLGAFVFAFLMAVLPFILYFMVRAAGMISLDAIGQKIMLVIASSYLLFVLGFFLAAWIDYYLDVMILTNFRIIDITQNVLFSRSVAEANLTDIEDVNAEVKGVLPTLFHYGKVFVQTAGTARNFEFDSLPNPYDINKMIVDLHQKSLLAEEKRETKEISKTLLEGQRNGRDITPKDIHRAAHRIIRRSSDFPRENTEAVVSDKPKPDQESQAPSDGQKVDNNQPISHDDLEKGGEVDLK